MRSFLAIEINQETRNSLAEIQRQLKKSAADLKLVPPENIHLTLHFLGNIPGKKAQELKFVLDKTISEFSAFSMQPRRLGCFPEIKNPRVIWIGIEKGKEELMRLQKKIGNTLQKIDLKTNQRRYHPHLTLARVKSAKNRNLLAKIIQEIKPPEFTEIQVKEVTLFESTLTPGGALYSPLAKLPLARDAAKS